MAYLLFTTVAFLLFINSDCTLRSYSTALIAELGPFFHDSVLLWNGVVLQAEANDYDSNIAGVPDQPGPTAASRAFAIIHGAMYEAMAIFDRTLKTFRRPNGLSRITNDTRQVGAQAAIMEAAYQTLFQLFPKQRPIFDDVRRVHLRALRNASGEGSRIARGITVGQTIASFILSQRANDGSQVSDTYVPYNQSGYHQVDPTKTNQGYLGPNWGNVEPFIINSGSQFRASSRVGETIAARRRFLNSNEYINGLKEVKWFGARVSRNRTADQTEIGIFWAYDGAPKLGVPPRLYNQLVRVVATQQNNTIAQNALLFAMINYGMADAGIAAWDTKYYYGLWRPIVGVRGTSVSLGGDPSWLPLGAPSDGNGDNFTPSFPSYVSGHATFGSVICQILREFYDTDNIRFQFQSDEFNGQTIDSITRRPRATRIRRYRSFSQAEEENYLSRIYLGVHWRIDQEEGQIMGRQIGSYVYAQMS